MTSGRRWGAGLAAAAAAVVYGPLAVTAAPATDAGESAGIGAGVAVPIAVVAAVVALLAVLLVGCASSGKEKDTELQSLEKGVSPSASGSTAPNSPEYNVTPNLRGQLPNFLLLDYDKDVKSEVSLTSGGAATIFRGSLIKPEALKRCGNKMCALKKVHDMPSLAEELNQERFLDEVRALWALSDNDNVMKLVGYTLKPRVIITRLYPTDLFRFLHAQEDHSPLPPPLVLHFCSSMVSILAAVHAIGMAHRDITAPNFLLQESKRPGGFPEPVLCDFGNCRFREDSPFSHIRGYSPRYSPPEVFARVHLRNASSSIDDDQVSDVYSMGVVMWETTTRQMPWGTTPNEKVEMQVRGGGRLPPLQPKPGDKITEFIASMIELALHTSPERRPSAKALNSKFANFIRQLLGGK